MNFIEADPEADMPVLAPWLTKLTLVHFSGSLTSIPEHIGALTLFEFNHSDSLWGLPRGLTELELVSCDSLADMTAIPDNLKYLTIRDCPQLEYSDYPAGLEHPNLDIGPLEAIDSLRGLSLRTLTLVHPHDGQYLDLSDLEVDELTIECDEALVMRGAPIGLKSLTLEEVAVEVIIPWISSLESLILDGAVITNRTVVSTMAEYLRAWGNPSI